MLFLELRKVPAWLALAFSALVVKVMEARSLLQWLYLFRARWSPPERVLASCGRFALDLYAIDFVCIKLLSLGDQSTFGMFTRRVHRLPEGGEILRGVPLSYPETNMVDRGAYDKAERSKVDLV
ncbi:MAG: hypothetical protein ACYDHP_14365 [Ferrimicrobium sp.]